MNFVISSLELMRGGEVYVPKVRRGDFVAVVPQPMYSSAMASEGLILYSESYSQIGAMHMTELAKVSGCPGGGG